MFEVKRFEKHPPCIILHILPASCIVELRSFNGLFYSIQLPNTSRFAEFWDRVRPQRDDPGAKNRRLWLPILPPFKSLYAQTIVSTKTTPVLPFIPVEPT